MALAVVSLVIYIAALVAMFAGVAVGVVLLVVGVKRVRHRNGGVVFTLSGIVLAATFTTLLVALFTGAWQSPPEHPSARLDAPAATITVPRFVDHTVDWSHSRVDAWSTQAHPVTIHLEDRDYSPLQRAAGGGPYDTWLVVKQSPESGTIMTTGTRLTLYELPVGEVVWFRSHPRMPHIPKGTIGQDLFDTGPFGAVYSLVEYRFAPGSGLRGVRAPDDGGTVVGTIPAAGHPLRLGQKIVVLEREARDDLLP